MMADEDIPGATAQVLSISVTYEVIDNFVLGDVNCDGVINLLDVGPFIDALGTGNYLEKADINQDGLVNLLDVGLFIDLLGS